MQHFLSHLLNIKQLSHTSLFFFNSAVLNSNFCYVLFLKLAGGYSSFCGPSTCIGCLANMHGQCHCARQKS